MTSTTTPGDEASTPAPEETRETPGDGQTGPAGATDRDGAKGSDAGDAAGGTGAGDSDRQVVAIVPAYNEADAIREVVVETRPHVDRVVVIDDASTDDTAARARAVADGVVTHPRNMGVGGAVHTGYRVGLREGADVVIQIDGDGQHDPADIPRLLARMDETGADMVIGSRWRNESYREYSLVRRAGIRFFTAEVNLLGGLDVTDVTSGFRAYSAELLADLRRPANSHWAVEQTLEAARKGYDVAEVSTPMPPETEGSQFDLGTFLRYPPRMVRTTVKVLLFR